MFDYTKALIRNILKYFNKHPFIFHIERWTEPEKLRLRPEYLIVGCFFLCFVPAFDIYLWMLDSYVNKVKQSGNYSGAKVLPVLLRKKKKWPVFSQCFLQPLWRMKTTAPTGQGADGRVLLARAEMPVDSLAASTGHRSLLPSSEALDVWSGTRVRGRPGPARGLLRPSAPCVRFMDGTASAAPSPLPYCCCLRSTAEETSTERSIPWLLHTAREWQNQAPGS